MGRNGEIKEKRFMSRIHQTGFEVNKIYTLENRADIIFKQNNSWAKTLDMKPFRKTFEYQLIALRLSFRDLFLTLKLIPFLKK